VGHTRSKGTSGQFEAVEDDRFPGEQSVNVDEVRQRSETPKLTTSSGFVPAMASDRR
jgi:hypothetical protein